MFCLTRSAIRCCFVDTSTGSDAPAMFPSNGVMTRRPLLSAGSLGVVPPPHRYYGTLRLPTVPLASLRCLRSAIQPVASWFAPKRPRRAIVGSGELMTRFPSRVSRWRRSGLPGSWGTLMIIVRALRPRQDRSRSVGPSETRPARPPLMSTTKAPGVFSFGAQSHGL
jgi:hypothetical protein